IDAQYTKNQAVIFGVTQHYGPFSDTPKVNVSAYSQITFPTPENIGELSLRGDVYYQSSWYFSSLNGTVNPGTQLPSYTLVNLRLALDKIGGSNFSLAASVHNLTDETYYTGGLAEGSTFGLNIANVGKPRTYFIEAKYTF